MIHTHVAVRFQPNPQSESQQISCGDGNTMSIVYMYIKLENIQMSIQSSFYSAALSIDTSSSLSILFQARSIFVPDQQILVPVRAHRARTGANNVRWHSLVNGLMSQTHRAQEHHSSMIQSSILPVCLIAAQTLFHAVHTDKTESAIPTFISPHLLSVPTCIVY